MNIDPAASSNLLIDKYNVPGPRYTSYPTVPYWDAEGFSRQEWLKHVSLAFSESNLKDGVSLYIHLPFCEKLCTYCGCNTRITVNHAVEVPYIKTVLQEWKLYQSIFGRSPHIKEIHLGGGTPTFFSPENLFLLMDGIVSGSIIQDDAEFSFEGHPVNTTFEHLQMLYGLGFRRVSFGVQDFDPIVQETINRFQTEEEVERVTEWSRSLGYTSVNYDLVYGLPKQTLSSVEDTISKVIRLRPDRIAFYSYAHVPWLKPGQRKYTEEDLPDGNEKRRLYEMGRTMFLENGYLEIGMDHFALPEDPLFEAMKNKKMHRNFMGYTSSKTGLMIGLGVSSISDTPTAFAQNSKVVEEYSREVNNGNIPVFRGHLLTDEDIIMRKHITNIICEYETSWALPTLFSQGVIEAIIDLKELEKDGLLVLSTFGLKVTEIGKPFVRNICMAFDRRLQEKELNRPLFSKVV